MNESPSQLMDFPLEEYQVRIKRLHSLLEDAKIDAIIVSEYNNFRYFAGFDRPFSAWSGYIRTRPFICILPLNSDPLLIIHASFANATRSISWINNVREWTTLPFTAKIVEDVLEDIGLDKNVTLGFELGGEQRFGFPPESYLKLQEDLSHVRFVDASQVLTKLRIKKSDRELDCMRKACEITSQAYTQLFESLGEGFSEKEIEFTMRKLMTVEQGEGPNFALVSIFPGGVVGRKPGNRSLKKGDALWIDAGAIYNGYRSDFSRVAVVGEPSTDQKNTYNLIRSITHSVISAIKPGKNMADLTKLCNEEMQKAGIPPKAAGRIGHGIGLDTGEAPSVMIADHTILEPGVVITIEPGYLAEYGYFVLEEICAVTDTGCEVLTTQSLPSLPVLRH